MTLAPECVPSFMIDELIGAGSRIAVGHSDATAAEIGQAVNRGVSGVTHLFNAMSQLDAREPGLVGAALQDDRLFAGIICDGIHVVRAGLRIAFRCKGRDRLMLVTDAMPLVGTNDRRFSLQERQITLHENRLTGPDGTLAGAHLTMIEAVRNAVALLEIPLADVLTMVSRTPAAFLGLDSELGRIAPGYRADLVAFNPNFEVVGTWVGGVGSMCDASEILTEVRCATIPSSCKNMAVFVLKHLRKFARLRAASPTCIAVVIVSWRLSQPWARRPTN